MSKVLLVLVVLLGGAAVFVATRPDTYHVERSATVAAPAATVFGVVDDLATWKEWSPWATTTGVGASYAWEGNKEVGKGKMTIVDSRPNERVVQKLEFIEPFQSVAEVSFAFKSDSPDNTKVTWAIDGKHNFISKAINVVKPMDKMMGPDFDAGLASLKRVAEARKPPPPPPAPPAAEAPKEPVAEAKKAPEPAAKKPAKGK
jgi:ribosome-associated toxin RatA of RatAB toxin-antitoxin module